MWRLYAGLPDRRDYGKAQVMKYSVVEYTCGGVSEDVKALWRNVGDTLGQ
jgi:hypothetical protein